MTTENHELNTPDEGTLNWDEPLNENFRLLDTGIEVRDTEANIDQYAPKDGAKYLATDTGRRYLGDGDQWNEAPVHLPDLLDAPTYSDRPTETTTGELWYQTDIDALVVQTQAGSVNLMTGETISTTSGDDGSGTDDSGSTDDSNSTTHSLKIAPADGADWNTYSAVIDGEVVGTQNLDSGDLITENSDGTVMIEGGVKGGKDPETFEFNGSLTNLSLEVDGTAYLDDQVIDPEDY